LLRLCQFLCLDDAMPFREGYPLTQQISKVVVKCQLSRGKRAMGVSPPIQIMMGSCPIELRE